MNPTIGYLRLSCHINPNLDTISSIPSFRAKVSNHASTGFFHKDNNILTLWNYNKALCMASNHYKKDTTKKKNHIQREKKRNLYRYPLHDK